VERRVFLALFAVAVLGVAVNSCSGHPRRRGPSDVGHVDARRDGVNVAFRQRQGISNPTYIVLVNISTGKTTMLAAIITGGIDDAVRNGWTAFTKPESPYLKQVRTRAPDGTLRQVTPLGSSSSITAIGDDGTVIFPNGQRYLATPGGVPQAISSSLGTVLWRDGGFVEILGRWAYGIVP
jgi:hypothetical protein